MPDFSLEGIKFNPGPPVGAPVGEGGGNTANDYSGLVLGGSMMGVVKWVDPFDSGGDLALAKAGALAPIRSFLGLARFVTADAAGLYMLGAGDKIVSGGASAAPGFIFRVPAGSSPIPAEQKWSVAALLINNGVAVLAAGTDFEVGFYRVTAAGTGGTMTYTLSTTGKIVQSFTAGMAASSTLDGPGTDRRTDFNSAGDQLYAVGVNLSVALPAGCVVDVRVGLQVEPA